MWPSLACALALPFAAAPKQSPRLGRVLRPTIAKVVHAAEAELRLGVALHCSEPEQPPRLGKVLRPTLAGVVHAAEAALRRGVALRYSEPE